VPLPLTFHSCPWTYASSDRRSQVLSSTSRVVPSSYVGPALGAHHEPDPADVDEENLLTPRPGSCTPHEPFISNLDWDEDDLVFSAYPCLQRPTEPSHEIQNRREHVTAISRQARVDERTALLPRLPEETSATISSRHCADSVPNKSDVIGQSTFSQTVSLVFILTMFAILTPDQLFNATGLLLGIGMLSEPLAFSYAGWICGTLLIVLYGSITCYT
jgi:solute carrier family 32 (vesicular inhibitory amino acid transporter)